MEEMPRDEPKTWTVRLSEGEVSGLAILDKSSTQQMLLHYFNDIQD